MKVVILCGGQGTRLREETEARPKPMVLIGNRPIVWHIMKNFAHYGYKEFILCLGYRGHMIKEYFLNYEAMNNDFTICLGQRHRISFHDAHEEQDFHVTLADTGLETMTGGRVKRIQDYITEENFIVTYGDGLADLDLDQLVKFHQNHGKTATVTTVHPLSRFGVLDLGRGGHVHSFKEKPILDGWISAGFFVFNRKIFDLIKGDESVLETLPLQRLTAKKQLRAFQHSGFFFAMDTYREYKYLNELWDGKKAPWKVWK